MNIGLIADSHIPEAMLVLPDQVRHIFTGVDLILHAGDLHCLDVLDWLEDIAPVLAARGNGDNGSGGRPVVPDDPRLDDAQVVTSRDGRSGWYMMCWIRTRCRNGPSSAPCSIILVAIRTSLYVVIHMSRVFGAMATCG